MFVAGLNVFWFYSTYSKQVKATDSTISVVEQAKLIAGVSLLCWTIVIICGRLITYFRPPLSLVLVVLMARIDITICFLVIQL